MHTLKLLSSLNKVTQKSEKTPQSHILSLISVQLSASYNIFYLKFSTTWSIFGTITQELHGHWDIIILLFV